MVYVLINNRGEAGRCSCSPVCPEREVRDGALSTNMLFGSLGDGFSGLRDVQACLCSAVIF